VSAPLASWLEGRRDEVSRFEAALERPDLAQESLLLGYLEANRETAFGREHGFAELRSVADFQNAVPLRNYEGLHPWIERCAQGESAVLTTEPVLAFEETSGSGGQAKWIPYTATLKDEFERALVLWFSSIQRQHPGALAGKSYWSLSPPVKAKRQAPCGLKVGLANDLEYFSPETAQALAQTMALTPELSGITEAGAFFEETVRQLESCRELSLISVWSPVFFLRLDDFLLARRGDDFVWSDLWPDLALLSCWADAQSAAWIPRVRERLGGVPIQGKGLLSTEGVVSFPWATGCSPTLALTSHFLEFLDPGTGKVSLAPEVQERRSYEVVLTTGGGLYRYRTGDLVEFTDAANVQLRFLGRAGRSSDLVGEKLTEQQANEAIAISPGARFLAAEVEGGTRRYVVGTSADVSLLDIERALRHNPYYAQARDLQQLAALRTQVLNAEEEQALLQFLAERQGCALGDVKIPGLFTREEWEGWRRRP